MTTLIPSALKEAIACASGLNVTVSDIGAGPFCEALGVVLRELLLGSTEEWRGLKGPAGVIDIVHSCCFQSFAIARGGSSLPLALAAWHSFATQDR
jgi:hypothetical protein